MQLDPRQQKDAVSPAFVKVWVAQTLSHLGDSIFLASAIWAATLLYGSNFGTLGVGLALFVPAAVLLPFGGVIIDRYPRQPLLLATDVVRAVLTLALGLVMLRVEPAATTLLVTVAAVRIAGILFTPAMHTLLGEIARSDSMLLKLDSWMLASRMLAGIIGPLISGVVISVGLGIALLINSATFVISCIALYAGRHLLARPKAPTKPHEGLLVSAKAGASVAFGDRIFRTIAPTLPTIDMVASGLTLLLPTLLISRSETSATSYGALISAWAIGRFGGLLLLRVPLIAHRRGVLLATNCFLQGLVICAISFSPSLEVTAALFLCLGLPSGGASVCVNTYIQTEIPNEFRGRVFSLLQSLVAIAMPLGPLLGGALTSWADPSTAVLALGGLLVAIGIPPLLSSSVWRWKAPANNRRQPATGGSKSTTG